MDIVWVQLSFVLAWVLQQTARAELYQETKTEVCYNDMFRARCQFSQQIHVTRGRYGHIEPSRCVADDFAAFGKFGCYADVTSIIEKRCQGKSLCEVQMPDAEVTATKTCLTGLPMYLEVFYVCLPETVSHVSCSGLPVTRQQQYITSSQVIQANCASLGNTDTNLKHISLRTGQNLKIKFTFRSITKTNATSDPLGYIEDGAHGNLAVQIGDSQLIDDIITKGHEVMLLLTDASGLLLIGFQEVGCTNMDAPMHSWIERNGDVTTVGCHSNSLTWQLKCIGSNWIGSTGNCTNEIKVTHKEEVVSREETKVQLEEKETLPKEVLFALIIGITFFLCAVVITTGFVCLKRAKYAAGASHKDMELSTVLYDGEGTSSWSRKPVNPNGQVIHNQTGTMHSTLPVNQKYYILDRDEMATPRT